MDERLRRRDSQRMGEQNSAQCGRDDDHRMLLGQRFTPEAALPRDRNIVLNLVLEKCR